MIDDILHLIEHSPIVDGYHILQRDLAPGGEFILKVRCRIKRQFTFQVRIKNDPAGVRYAYQLFFGATTILRWDNAPHFPGLRNYPHHFHDTRGDSKPSVLVGEPIQDLSFVLSEVEKYFETQT